MLKIARGALCGLKEPTGVAMRVKAPPLCKFIGRGEENPKLILRRISFLLQMWRIRGTGRGRMRKKARGKEDGDGEREGRDEKEDEGRGEGEGDGA